MCVSQGAAKPLPHHLRPLTFTVRLLIFCSVIEDNLGGDAIAVFLQGYVSHARVLVRVLVRTFVTAAVSHSSAHTRPQNILVPSHTRLQTAWTWYQYDPCRCAGDINPLGYKDVDTPRHAEPLGNTLGLSALRGLRGIAVSQDDRLRVIHEVVSLPRVDAAARITKLEAERNKLVETLSGTFLDLKTYVGLAVKHGLSNAHPSRHASRYGSRCP